MASSNTSSPKELAELSIDVADSQGGINIVLNEEISPLGTSGEVDEVSVGVGEKSPIRCGTLTDAEHAQIKKLRWDFELSSSSAASPTSTN